MSNLSWEKKIPPESSLCHLVYRVSILISQALYFCYFLPSLHVVRGTINSQLNSQLENSTIDPNTLTTYLSRLFHGCFFYFEQFVRILWSNFDSNRKYLIQPQFKVFSSFILILIVSCYFPKDFINDLFKIHLRFSVFNALSLQWNFVIVVGRLTCASKRS